MLLIVRSYLIFKKLSLHSITELFSIYSSSRTWLVRLQHILCYTYICYIQTDILYVCCTCATVTVIFHNTFPWEQGVSVAREYQGIHTQREKYQQCNCDIVGWAERKIRKWSACQAVSCESGHWNFEK